MAKGSTRGEAETERAEGALRASGVAPKADRAVSGSGFAVKTASRVDELHRLYAAGEVEAAQALAASLERPHGLSLASVPEIAMTAAELRTLPLDHRAGFLLARIDGRSPLEAILDACPMPEDEVLALLESLIAFGAVRLV